MYYVFLMFQPSKSKAEVESDVIAELEKLEHEFQDMEHSDDEEDETYAERKGDNSGDEDEACKLNY